MVTLFFCLLYTLVGSLLRFRLALGGKATQVERNERALLWGRKVSEFYHVTLPALAVRVFKKKVYLSFFVYTG